MAAAADVFRVHQYLDTKVAQIAERAGVSHGTFYTYFDSKEDIFRELCVDLQERVRVARDAHMSTDEGATVFEQVERANRGFLETYRDNAGLFAVVEQVATFNEEFRNIRRDIRAGYVTRSQKVIARLQAEGVVVDDIDARYAAEALGSMVERFAYVWLVMGEEFDLDDAVYNLTMLWARALGIDVPE